MFQDYFKELKNLEVYETESGFVLYRVQNDDELYVRDVYVAPQFRRKGIASKMVDELSNLAKESGCKLLIVDVEPSNNNATESIKLILAYGMRVAEANDDEILFVKEI
jgi:ribosomal protein S18 acetylase RimI-like enzyme